MKITIIKDDRKTIFALDGRFDMKTAPKLERVLLPAFDEGTILR